MLDNYFDGIISLGEMTEEDAQRFKADFEKVYNELLEDARRMQAAILSPDYRVIPPLSEVMKL